MHVGLTVAVANITVNGEFILNLSCILNL